jgi:hypothetical protein
VPSLCANVGKAHVKDEVKLACEGSNHTSMMGVGVAVLWRSVCTAGQHCQDPMRNIEAETW